MGTPLACIRTRCSKLFYRFGIHCATHQIRLILISGLVITSLFYPALGIYASSNSRFFPTSTHILAHIDLLSLSFFHDDLESVWAGHDALRIVQDTVSRAKCGLEKTLRVERVLLTTNGFDSEHGAITHELLSSGLKMETRLNTYAKMHNLNCLDAPSGKCLVLSPLDYWSHDEQILRTDTDLLRTVNAAPSFTGSGLPLRKTMVFAGRESVEANDGPIDFAAYLASTYLFHEDDCNGSNGHNNWLKALDSIIASHGVVSVKAEDPVFLTLTFDPDMKSETHISLITLTLYLSYLIFFVYFSGSMRRMNTVHSRIGLCFTGLVEILVSTITSLSVCALYGLRLTLIPWGIFPIVIVFVGAENMFRLIDDVVNTPVSLPVKERIGLGLGRAGTSNTLKVVFYNSILGVIAFFAQGAIRQFCAFAIVVLVAHWFLIHTFFVAVLSIDIQRLELDDLIRQNPSLAPAKHVEPASPSSSKSKKTKIPLFSRLQASVKNLTKGRLTKNVSLLLMLVIAATLYYSTLPSSGTHHRDPSHPTVSRTPRLRSASGQTGLTSHADAQKIWHVLSPDDDPRVHIRIEPPIIITLDRHLGGMKHTERPSLQSRWSTRSLRPIVWILKIMVLPIGVTLSCLYMLLLYLLKGTDLLEGSKETLDGEAGAIAIEGQPTLKVYPRAFAFDVAFLASSSDGGVLLTVSVDGDFILWLDSSQQPIFVDIAAFFLPDAADSLPQVYISAVAVDRQGRYFAVGTTSGLVLLWSIEDNQPILVDRLHPNRCPSMVVELVIERDNNYDFNCESPPKVTSAPTITVNYEDGNILRWSGGSSTPLYPSSQANVIKAKLVYAEDIPAFLACFFLCNGDMEIVDISGALLPNESMTMSIGTPNDIVTNADLARVTFDDKPILLVAAARSSGAVSVWSIAENICIASIEDDYGAIDKLRIFRIISKACSQCGEVPLCNFGLAHSVGNSVFIDRGTLSRRCSCPVNQIVVHKAGSVKESSLGRHSRNGSFVGLVAENGLRPRSRKSSLTTEGASLSAPFPVSGHGIHSRRASEKDYKRANGLSDGDTLLTREDISVFDHHESQRQLLQDKLSFPSQNVDKNEEVCWRNLKLLRIGEASCERGNWDIGKGKIVGVSRKPRKQQTNTEHSVNQTAKNLKDRVLSLSVLGRWELWILDPSRTSDVVRSSELSEIKQTAASKAQIYPQFPTLSFARLFPVIIKETFGLVGFGNTVGMLDLRTSLCS